MQWPECGATRGYFFWTFAACGPFGPCVTSKVTSSPSFRLLNPSPTMALYCTNTSGPPERDPERRPSKRGHGPDHDQSRDPPRLLEQEPRRRKRRKGRRPRAGDVELLQGHDARRLDKGHRDRVDRERDPSDASPLGPS